MQLSKKILFSTFLISTFIYASAEEPLSIVATLNNSGVISVTQPEAMNSRLVVTTPASTEESSGAESSETVTTQPTKVAGFRVQVFSDNNARTAKNEARSKARAIADAFPQFATYVTYTSPYWRLKVGDFRTQEEAEVAAALIKKHFPAYSTEIRIVRDRINAQPNN